MKNIIKMLVVFALLTNLASASLWNPVISEKTYSGECTAKNPNTLEVTLDSETFSVSEDNFDFAQVGCVYLYTKIDYLFGEDEEYFETM